MIAPVASYAAPVRPLSLLEAAMCTACRILGWRPHRIGWGLGIPFTVYAVLRRTASRGSTAPRGGRALRACPSCALVHLDIKKLGRIPQGGGKRILPWGSQRRTKWSSARPSPRFRVHPRSGRGLLPLCLREALPDEHGVSATASWLEHLTTSNALASRSTASLTDTGACYGSRIFTSTVAARDLRVKRTRPFRPQTNGKAKAFNKIM